MTVYFSNAVPILWAFLTYKKVFFCCIPVLLIFYIMTCFPFTLLRVSVNIIIHGIRLISFTTVDNLVDIILFYPSLPDYKLFINGFAGFIKYFTLILYPFKRHHPYLFVIYKIWKIDLQSYSLFRKNISKPNRCISLILYFLTLTCLFKKLKAIIKNINKS